MKKKLGYISSTVIFLFILVVSVSCADDYKDFEDIDVSSVKTLLDPVDGKQINLQTTPDTLSFKWEKAQAADGSSIVYYDVLFDKEDGDFSAPVYIQVSDGKGLNTGASILPTIMDEVAEAAGAGAGESISLKWTVRSNRGIKSRLADESRKLTVVRKYE